MVPADGFGLALKIVAEVVGMFTEAVVASSEFPYTTVNGAFPDMVMVN